MDDHLTPAGGPPTNVGLLEAFLLRLARDSDPDAFVLRGGMRVRQLVADVGRPALDVDLVCRLPYDPPAVTQRLRAVLAYDVGDGVWFDADRARLNWLWRPEQPGMRLVSSGIIDGVPGRVVVDVLFGMTLWPPPTRTVLRTLRGTASLWMAQPETLIARKLQVVTQLGHRWRPKDLWDLELLLGRTSDKARLDEAIEAAFADTAERPADARDLLADPGRWRSRAARWGRFAARRGDVQPHLDAVIASVGRGLAPVLASARLAR